MTEQEQITTDLHPLHLTVNGKDVDSVLDSRISLADFLRHELRLTGTHLGCEQGSCGACTVIVDGVAVRSCLMFAVQLNGSTVETVESLCVDGQLSRLQQAFHEEHALQCGFCTSGFLMSLTAHLREHQVTNDQEAREALSGNICRCTGYAGMVKALLAVGDGESTTQ